MIWNENGFDPTVGTWKEPMLIKFWGVHGSLPRPGPATLKFGGNTACVEVRCGKDLVIFDAGSGIRDLGDDLMKRSRSSQKQLERIIAHIFFSHLHWDHVQGFPFFAPAFVEGNELHLYGGRDLDRTIYAIMNIQMSHPTFPLNLSNLGAKVAFYDLDSGTTVSIGEARVHTQKLNHPGGSLGYRLEQDGKTVVYATDTEHTEEMGHVLQEFARNADALIYDSMFTPDQYSGLEDDMPRRSWGHSTWEAAVGLAEAAGVKQLILFHHGNEDAVVADIERQARERFPRTVAAYEGLEIEL